MRALSHPATLPSDPSMPGAVPVRNLPLATAASNAAATIGENGAVGSSHTTE